MILDDFSAANSEANEDAAVKVLPIQGAEVDPVFTALESARARRCR
jgi:hypothetical protein